MGSNSLNFRAFGRSSGGSKISKSVIFWGIAALVLTIIMSTIPIKNSTALVSGGAFFMKLFIVIIGTVLGLGGALLGDVLRKFAHPDSVYTSGGFFDLIKIKIFWACGPQVIGLGIGLFVGWIFAIGLGCAIVLKCSGHS